MATGADVRDILELAGGDTDTGPISKKDIINSDKKRSVEDLKERYYNICGKLTKVRAPTGTEPKVYIFDAGHERRRKDQLERLFNRTPEQVAEEEYLIQELRKIETRKKEREKKAQDLQKLITAADSTTEMRRGDRKATKKKPPQKREAEKPAVPETAGIKFPDFKSAGVSLRSQRKRSVEDLKERYYNICGKLTKVRAPTGTEPKVYIFDAGHERRRKDQLERLFNRTPEQVAEEEYLIQELRKIETRKKEREKKAQDLQKLITAADSTTEMRRGDRKATKKKPPQKREAEKPAVPETAGIKFPDFKSAGVSLRSQRMKLPSSVGQKKIKAIEQILTEQGVDLNPMPTEEIVAMFNELRSDLVLLYELKQAHSNCEYEQQMLRHRYDALLKAGGAGTPHSDGTAGPDSQNWAGVDDIKTEPKEQIIDVVGAPLTPNSRKRRESASSSSSVKKMKKP
ncbi:hypothetical protein PDJAM_G00237400 [Pangasius djambal]|uniref:Uncharacterized protein n=1 Tax=Pangasius djambal TaxID=1691987 RepID=A0ACC5YG49_9TELE|nr:hypothetical protein [Pangasius djambal]